LLPIPVPAKEDEDEDDEDGSSSPNPGAFSAASELLSELDDLSDVPDVPLSDVDPPPDVRPGSLGAGSASSVESCVVEPPVEPKVEPPVEPPVEPAVEPPVDPPAEPPVEPKVEPLVEPLVEPPVDPPVFSIGEDTRSSSAAFAAPKFEVGGTPCTEEVSGHSRDLAKCKKAKTKAAAKIRRTR
jgi:hypothetical protein